MNNVSLIGNLATEVELRDVGEEKKVAGFLLAVDRGGRDAGADFVGVSVWDRQAEVCAEYLSKGQRVGVGGYLRSRSWETRGQTAHRRRGGRTTSTFSPARGGETKETGEGAEVIPFETAATN